MRLFGAQAVLFDLDGVITPTADLHMQAWAGLFAPEFEQRGVKAYTDADYFHFLDGKPRTAGIGSLLADRGISVPEGADGDPADAETIHGFGARKNEIFLELLAAGIEPYPGSVRFIEALLAESVPVAVVSSSKNAPAVLDGAGLLDRFPVIVDGRVAQEKGLPGKPAPDTFQYGAQLLGVEPAAALVIEDAVSGVQAGAAGGFAGVVGVDRGAGAAALEAAGATCVVRDLAELL